MQKLILTGVALFCLSVPVMAHDAVKDVHAVLVNDAGKDVGKATISVAGDDGVLVTVEATGLAPGWHGLHMHTIGNCDDHADHFKMAGGHLAGKDEKHGFLNAAGPHKGDLPNIWVHEDGTAKVQIFSEDLEMEDVMDQDGAALMIHETADDYLTDPAGASGARLACGVLAP